MNLSISSFADPNDLEKERLVMKAATDLDIGTYAVFSSSISEDGKPYSGRKSAFWFPDGPVKAGDLVILYTKQGTRGKKNIADGHTAHFYYWGLDKPIWDDAKTAVVLRVAEWTHYSVSASKAR